MNKSFSKEELYGLTNQAGRSIISVPSNIPEKSQRGSSKEFVHFILTAKSSLAELETQVILSHELEFILESELENIIRKIDELNRMLFSFRKKLTTDH